MWTTVGILLAIALIPVLYAVHGAWSVKRETTDLTRQRHKAAADQRDEARARAAAKKKRSAKR